MEVSFLGVWDFHINLKIGTNDANSLLKVYNSNELYQSAFHYGIVVEWLENEYNVGISSVIDSFLPANSLIFQFLSTSSGEHPNYYIKTRDVERSFNFDRKADFINFMYNVWEDKIDAYYKQMGGLLLDHRNYYKIRNRLFKKYYKKL